MTDDPTSTNDANDDGDDVAVDPGKLSMAHYRKWRSGDLDLADLDPDADPPDPSTMTMAEYREWRSGQRP